MSEKSITPSQKLDRRKATYALCLTLPVPTLGVMAGMFWLPESGLGQWLFGLSKIWIVLLPVIWHRIIEGKPLSWSPAKFGGWGVALATGIPVALMIWGAFLWVRHLGWIDIDMIQERAELTGLAKPAVFIGAAVYWITINSLLEEYVWRWFVFRQFERLVGSRWAVVASALGFTAHHIAAIAAQFDWKINLLASSGVFVGGLIWSWIYLRYRSVWPCWLSHACADVPIFVAGWLLICA